MRVLRGYEVVRFPGPVEGGIGPGQYPFASATGTSSRKDNCIFKCPSINLTSTIIPRDALSSDHQYQPGWVGLWFVAGELVIACRLRLESC